MFIQEWSGAVRDKDRYEIYRSFKTIFEKGKYILNTDIYIYIYIYIYMCIYIYIYIYI